MNEDFGIAIIEADKLSRKQQAAELRAIILDPNRRSPADVARCAAIQSALALPPDFTGRRIAEVNARDAAKASLGTAKEQAACRAEMMAGEPDAIERFDALWLKMRRRDNSALFKDIVVRVAGWLGRADVAEEAKAVISPVDEVAMYDGGIRQTRQELCAAEDRLQMGLKQILPEPVAPEPARPIRGVPIERETVTA